MHRFTDGGVRFDSSDDILELFRTFTVHQLYSVCKALGVTGGKISEHAGRTVGTYTDLPVGELRPALAKLCWQSVTAAALSDALMPIIDGGDGAKASRAAAAAGDGAPAAMAKLAEALALLGGAKGIDEQRVRSIVDEAVSAAMLPQSFSVKRTNGETKDVGVQHQRFPLLLKALSAGCHVWLAGPAGSGKSHAAWACAESLGLPFYALPALDNPYAVTGYNDATGRHVKSAVRRAWEDGGVLLLDEVAGSDPRALLPLFDGLGGSGRMAFADGEVVKKHADCYVVACDNTYGYGGGSKFAARGRQDGAFLARFLSMRWDFCPRLEKALVPDRAWHAAMLAARKVGQERNLDRADFGTRCGQRAQLLSAQDIDRDTVVELVWQQGLDDDAWSAVREATIEAHKGASR